MTLIKRHPKLYLACLALLLLVLFFIAINMGSIKVSPLQLLKGLFVDYNSDVASIYSIRFPRIFIAMCVGAALGLSGLIFQVVLKNPLADPGIIGISNGASLAAVLVTTFFPQLYFFTPLIAFVGGMITFIIIYLLSWQSGFKTTRILLIGVALNYTISGIISLCTSSSMTLTSNVAGNISLKTWSEAGNLMIYILPVILLALCLAKACNLLGLEDRTLMSLGINVNIYRFGLSLIAVLLCSISVATAGVISFIGLLVPHLSRVLIGNDHRILLPSSCLMGAIILLAADTLGRVIMSPYEISSAIIMAIVGGPVFIVLLKRSMTVDGK